MVDDVILFILEHLVEIGITVSIVALVLMWIIIKLIKDEIKDRE